MKGAAVGTAALFGSPGCERMKLRASWIQFSFLEEAVGLGLVCGGYSQEVETGGVATEVDRDLFAGGCVDFVSVD